MGPITVAFVCVQNAGRSQMAAAFAKREKERRAVDVRILTGGTDPAEHVHPEVVETMQERGIDLGKRKPQEIRTEELHSSDIVITMGCSADDVCPANFDGTNRDWDLTDPDGRDPDTVRSIRDDVERRVSELFDELGDEI
ncbi:MAG: low molecular weight phosphatase family protein [bacterium]